VISDTTQTDALLELINRCVYRSVTPGGDSDTETTE
jgi:hypothetical protein